LKLGERAGPCVGIKMNDFESGISALDLGLFRHVLSQCTDDDKRSLLALQCAVRNRPEPFTYLEIGSYLGGSLQSYVVDPRCARIISIDPRPTRLADTRGIQQYQDNSTEAMLAGLRRIPGADTSKIISLEAGTDTLRPADLKFQPDLCFVDGEHTDEAAWRDAQYCLAVMQPDGCIAFHDAHLVYLGIHRFVQDVIAAGKSCRPYVLPSSVFVIDFGQARFGEMEPVAGRRRENYKAYLAGMMDNHWYRYAYHLPIYRFLRRIRRLFPKGRQ
jgi:hypothetical protein